MALCHILSSQVNYNLGYRFRAAQWRSSKVWSENKCTYDDLSRLATVNYGDEQAQSYTFDPMGNRLQRQDSVAGTTNSTYNAANMLTATTGTGASSYTSDADGDTLTGGGRTMTWDSQNRLVSCLLNNQTSTFTYGADGLRRSMTVGTGPTTDYAYDGQSMVREMQVNPTTGSLAATATYLTGPRGPEYRRDDTQTETDGQGHTFGKTRWYVFDGLGSVVGEVDPLGNLTCSDEYDVYGAVRGRVGTASTAHGFVGSLGHLSDASTGLIYMRARYYDPGTGRFASEDPGRNGDNWFVYCNSSPTNKSDPTGKAPFSIGLGPEQVEKIWDLLAEDPDATLGDIFAECFSGPANIATGSFGGVLDAVAVLRFEVNQVMTDIPGITADETEIIGHYVADENGQAGLAGIAQDPELVSISVLEGEVVVLDTTVIRVVAC